MQGSLDSGFEGRLGIVVVGWGRGRFSGSLQKVNLVWGLGLTQHESSSSFNCLKGVENGKETDGSFRSIFLCGVDFHRGSFCCGQEVGCQMDQAHLRGLERGRFRI